MRQTLQLTDLARMEPFIQGVRFRPEEVAAGMMWDDPPMNFETASPAGQAIADFLKAR
jgi:hypothetical protein